MDFLIKIIIFFTVLSSSIHASDTNADTIRERPENIDTITTAKSSNNEVIASYAHDFELIPLNKIHSWKILLTNKKKQPLSNMNIKLTTMMPEHLHGMTTSAQISSLNEPGRYLVEGMNFHMPGWWEITLLVEGDQIKEVLRFNLVVGEGSINQHHH